MHNNNVYIQIMIGGTPNIPFWTKAPKIKRLRVSSRVTFNIMRMFLPPPHDPLWCEQVSGPSQASEAIYHAVIK